MRTPPAVALLHDPKPSFLFAGFSRTARERCSGSLQSSTVVVHPSAIGPDTVHADASDASVGVVALGSHPMERPGGGTGIVTQPAVSYAPVVVLKNWHTSAETGAAGGSGVVTLPAGDDGEEGAGGDGGAAAAVDGGSEKMSGCCRLDGANGAPPCEKDSETTAVADGIKL